MKVVRIITYEGNEEWIKATLKHSVPDGQYQCMKVETIEFPSHFPPTEYGIFGIHTMLPKLR